METALWAVVVERPSSTTSLTIRDVVIVEANGEQHAKDAALQRLGDDGHLMSHAKVECVHWLADLTDHDA